MIIGQYRSETQRIHVFRSETYVSTGGTRGGLEDFMAGSEGFLLILKDSKNSMRSSMPGHASAWGSGRDLN